VVINILPQITQDTASKGFENVRKKGEIWHCWCEGRSHLV
jgi:hypothetical protein